MKTQKMRQWVTMVMALIVAGALLGACGAEQPTGKTVNTMSGAVSAGTPTAGLATCVSCHPVTTADWMLTKHANVEPLGNLYSAGNPTIGQIAGCATNCHDSTGDGAGNSFTAGYTGNVARPVVGCESCHSGGQLHADRGGSGLIGFATTTAMVIGTTSTLQASAQLRTCTGCHELLDPNDPLNTKATPTHLASTPTATGDAYIITDTHFATAGIWYSSSATTKDISGYAMDYASEKVCTNCHNPHRAPDQNREWAQSAHGDTNAVKTDYWSGAWAHYNWSCDGTNAAACGTSGPNINDRRACQRCHTTSGFAAYADALRSGNSSYADQINAGAVSTVTYTAGWKPEMLQCWGCHTDSKGTRRNPGQRITDYGYASGGKTYAIASYTYPDVADSNICMSCHTGRESGDTLLGLNDASLLTAGTITFFNFSNSSFINSHYLTGGGTVFAATGFEFSNRSYENQSSYRHDQIGSSSLPFSGSNGPCIGCHMSRPGGSGDHLFLPVTRSTTSIGHIDSIASEVCIYCHTVSGGGGLEDLINERKEEFEEAIEATAYVIGKRGFYFLEAYPYWYQLRTSTGTVAVTNGNTGVIGTGTLWSTGTTSVLVNTDYFKVDNDGTFYKIIGATGTTLTLDPAYEGVTAGGENYAILRGGSAGGIKNWLTQSGSGIVPATATDTDTSGNTTGRYNMAVCFNTNLLAHDPGAYVHNRIYVKRLLYDSIDWADDNLMNYSAGNTLNNLSSGAKYKIGAMKYLLPYGVLGFAAERP